MQDRNEIYTIEEDGWTVRVQPARAGEPQRTILMIHGRTGNETVMWIFAHKVPASYWKFAPRGPYPSDDGYAWLPHAGTEPALAEFKDVAARLMDAFQTWAGQAGAPVETFDVMGFSQGAAMAYALAAFYPNRINRIVALAGILPRDDEGHGSYHALSGKKIFIAHGTRDETVPVSMAKEAVQILQAVGADVSYCESDSGHKMSAGCLRGLEDFLTG